MGGARTFWIGLITALVVGIGSGVSLFQFGLAQLAVVRDDLPQVDAPDEYKPKLKTQVFAADGTLLTEIYRENRELLPLKDVPRAMVDATIATEDRRFRQHIGISPWDIGRAAVINLRERRMAQGASTLTQQLARDLYLSRRKQMRRKIGEAVLAVEIEKRYSKDEILELYLNEVNYGKGLYGLRTAAETYFGKPPKELTLAECATLAAIPQRPTSNNLYDGAEGARARRDTVLGLMCEQGYLSESQRDAARREPLNVKPYQPPDWRPRHAPYYTSYAVRELVDLLGEDKVYNGGLKVYTHLDLSLQQTADQAVRGAVRGSAGRGATQGAAVVLDVHTGAILALVGGTGWERSQFNRATQAHRQPGSCFKPFVYTAALERGFQPTDTIVDEPISVQDGSTRWRPTNYDHTWHGKVTLAHAIAQSINIPAIKLLQRVGAETVVGYAQRMGIRSPLRPYTSLALGTSEVTLLELTSAYSVYPGAGSRAEPTTIDRVEDLEGHVIYRRSPAPVAVLPPQTAEAMTNLLRGVMTEGTGKPAAIDAPCGGKTGTTQDGRDAWFVGFTPQLVCGVWLGNDEYKPMYGVFGGTDCGPAWRTIISDALHARGGAGEFQFPKWLSTGDPRNSGTDGVNVEITGHTARSEVKICPDSGVLAGPYCPHPVIRMFEPGQEPTEHCAVHTAPPKEPQPQADRPVGEPDDATAQPLPDRTDGAPKAAPPDEPALPDSPTNTPRKRTPTSRPAAIAKSYTICAESGLLARPGCPHKIHVEFAPSEAPTQECNLH